MSRIALLRGGALGDIIMMANCLPKLREQFDEIHLITERGTWDILGKFLLSNKLVDGMYAPGDFVADNYDKVVYCRGYPTHEGYPEVKMRKHVIEFFADEIGVEASFDALVCSIPETDVSFNSMPYVTIQNKTSWSIYKEWHGWQQLINKLRRKRPEVGIYQVGGPDDPPLTNIYGTFCGRSFEDNLAAQAYSVAHLGVDSLLQHTTNIRWNGGTKKSSVILWGSTQYDASGYSHNTNISLQLPCQPCFRENPGISTQPRGICPNPADQTYENPRHACMAGITVDMVYDATVNLLEKK